MAFTSEIPLIGDEMPPYIIYREGPVGQAADPTAPLVFFPAKDSDELFDALRNSFPHLKNHSERMREAVIKFLMEERETEQLQATMGLPNDALTTTTNTSFTSPFEHSWPSMSSGPTSTAFSSPETLELATPSFSMSPRSQQLPSLGREFSTATTTPSNNSEQSPPALENMTGVFSVSAGDQPKQRIRRKMTEAEKIEYRNRRLVKACEKCSKRKRKCTHNQPEMETLAAKQKVIKRTPPPTAKAKTSPGAAQQIRQALTDMGSFDFEATFAGDMQLFDDFTNLSEKPTQQYDYDWDQMRNFDHLLGVSDAAGSMAANARPQQMPIMQNQWHFDGQHDWPTPELPPTGELTAPAGFRNTTGGANIQSPTSGNNCNTNEAQKFDQIHYGDDETGSGSNSHGAYAPMLWEHLRTGQAQPTHTRHVHEADAEASYIFSFAGGAGASSNSDKQRASLAREVLRLTGTSKAIRAFGRCLRSNGPRRLSLLLVTSESVAGAIAHSVPQSHAFGCTDTHLLDVRGDRGSTTLSRMPPVLRNTEDTESSPSVFDRTQAPANGPLERMSISDYLRMEANFDKQRAQMGRGGQALPSMEGTQQQFGYTPDAGTSELGASSESMASTSVPRSSPSSSLDEGWVAQDQGRPAFTFGEGIDKIPSATSELFMLKRRIPKTMHSIVDRHRATIPTPLLQQGQPEGDWKDAMLISRWKPRTESITTEQAKGGAYLRLDTDNYTRPHAATLSASQTPEPADARLPSTPSSASSAKSTSASAIRPGLSSTDQLVEEGRYPQSSAATTSASAAYKGNANGALQQTHEAANEDEVYTVKKRDTFRCRDHFGRPAATASSEVRGTGKQARTSWREVDTAGAAHALNAVLAVICGALLLSSLLPAANAHATALQLLALFTPLAGADVGKPNGWVSVLRSAVGHGSTRADPGQKQKKSNVIVRPSPGRGCDEYETPGVCLYGRC